MKFMLVIFVTAFSDSSNNIPMTTMETIPRPFTVEATCTTEGAKLAAKYRAMLTESRKTFIADPLVTFDCVKVE